ncbi:glycosyl hydrolase family 28 protein [Sphingobacterium sp. LRF_L2]|uniref:glycosyl hydrolase family 28 protein n=1 Tax=Sphingobacterium sp. LRF_L2 TaxID=3369421 RepID=UPI003F60E705
MNVFFGKSVIYILILSVFFTISFPSQLLSQGSKVYSAPDRDLLSNDIRILIDDVSIPVYKCKVAPSSISLKGKAMSDVKNTADYFEEAFFANFDMKSKVKVVLIYKDKIEKLKILPERDNIKYKISNNSAEIEISKEGNYTFEVNDDIIHSIHLFANPPLIDLASVKSKWNGKLIYYGPGIHDVGHLLVESNTTVYVDEGAIIRGRIESGEKPTGISSQKHQTNGYSPLINLHGDNIKLIGRGIIDGSLLPALSKKMIDVRGNNIEIEGVTIVNSPHWTIPITNSNNVKVYNVKLIGYRANSDGIDVNGSRAVLIRGAFIRTLDDLIVIKTTKSVLQNATDIKIEKCVLWNQLAHALSIGAEVTKDITNVNFTNCDIIHDLGREWTLRIYNGDKGTVSNVSFNNIRVGESDKFISLWIGETYWSTDGNRGRIENVKFENISLSGGKGKINLQGFDNNSTVKNISFKGVRINNKLISKDALTKNKYVGKLLIKNL